MNPGLIKTYEAAGAMPGHCIVKAGPADGVVAPAVGGSDSFLGVSGSFGAASGMPVEVVHSGIVDVKLGGSVVFGDRVTSDANGCGVKAVGEVCEVIGKALESGNAGDIIRVIVMIAQIKG